MLDNAWFRCMACYNLGLAVGMINDRWIWLPLLVVGIVVLMPSMRSKITRGNQ